MWPIRATATAGIARGMPYRVLAAPRRLRSRLHGSCALLPAPCDDQQCAADNRQQEQATWHPRAMERGKEEDRHHEQRQTRHGDSHTRHHTPRSTRARLGHASPARGTRAPLMPIGRHASSPPLADRHRGIKGRPVPSGEEISHRAAKPRHHILAIEDMAGTRNSGLPPTLRRPQEWTSHPVLQQMYYTTRRHRRPECYRIEVE